MALKNLYEISIIGIFACFVQFSSVSSLSRISFERSKRFTFAAVNNSWQGQLEQQQQLFPTLAAQPNDGAVATDHSILTRQLIVGTLTPNVVIPPFAASYCQCLPPGNCPNPLPTVPSDGTGQIDIRIVNNGAIPTLPTTTTPLTCNYGLVACCYTGSYQCGRRFTAPPASIQPGSGQAYFGKYPWQAAILTTGDVYLGGGALLSAQHVLTAAHKVYNLALTSFKVRLGEWDAASTAEPIPAQDVSISNVYINPSFNPNNLQNDIAVLKLSSAVSLTDKSTVGTACLPTTAFVGQRCWVAGWGKNDFGPTGAYQAIQREVDVPLIPNADCQTLLRATRLGSTFVLDNASFICAGGEAGKDACTGDGGSPLVCQNNGIWYVVGLVAWGIGCAQGNVPGVYVNVANYLPWIQTALAS